MLSVYTARITYKGEDSLDISRKGNDPFGVIFAPTAALVYTYVQLRRVNKGLASQKYEAYTRSYLAEMRQSYRDNRAQWDKLLSWPSVTLLCYCTAPLECHRNILGATILPTLGATFEGERQAQLL